MTLAEIVGVITAAASVVIAWAAVRQLPLIVSQVRALSKQLEETRKAEKAAEKARQIWNTVERVKEYNTDPVFDAATKRVWEASNGGEDYRADAVKERDIIVILNFINNIATGVIQKLYIEEIVKDSLKLPIKHCVEQFITSGIVNGEGLESFVQLYNKWYPKCAPAYKHGAGDVGA